MVSSTVPRPAAKWPPRVLTLWIRNSRSSCARARQFAGWQAAQVRGGVDRAQQGIVVRRSAHVREVYDLCGAPDGTEEARTVGVKVRNRAVAFAVCSLSGAALTPRPCLPRPLRRSSVKGSGSRLRAAVQQDLDLLLRRLQGGLAVTGQRDTALEVTSAPHPGAGRRVRAARPRLPVRRGLLEFQRLVGRWQSEGSDGRADRAPSHVARDPYTVPRRGSKPVDDAPGANRVKL